MNEQQKGRLAEARGAKRRAERVVEWGGRQARRVDLERLRRASHLGERVAVYGDELKALVAVVDAARAYIRSVPKDLEGETLRAALEPFTPAGDDVDAAARHVEEHERARDRWAEAGLRQDGTRPFVGVGSMDARDALAFNVRMQERERERRVAALGIELVEPVAGRVEEARLAGVPALVGAARDLLSWVDGCCHPDVADGVREALAEWEQA